MAAVQLMGLFYADEGMIGSRVPELIQREIDVIIGLLIRFGLMANVAKSKTMTFQSGAICMWISK